MYIVLLVLVKANVGLDSLDIRLLGIHINLDNEYGTYI